MLKREAPHIVFFSTSTCTIDKDLLIAKAAKEVIPSVITVAIGTHVMALPEDTMRSSGCLDIAIYTGEWESASLEIVKNSMNPEKTRGIFYRNSNGDIIKTDSQPLITNLDLLGFPSHDKIERALYRDPTTKRFPKTIVMGQKACINNCSFCCQPAFFGAPTIRKRSIESFLDELKWVEALGFKELMFNDATLTADMEWATSLFEGMINSNIDLIWNCSTRADRINPEIVKLMKRAGCHTVALGMESVDSVVLKNIRKQIRPDQIKNAVSLMRKEGIDTLIFCVVGFPGETEESIKKTISFLKDLDTTFITLGIAVPTPGTDFYKYVEENNYLLTKDWSLYDPMKKPVFSYPDLSDEQIGYYSAYGLRQFYLRPEYILKRLLSIKNLNQLGTYLKSFVGFLRRYVLSDPNNRNR
ncbi:Fe-S oxidoreductase [Candidatus Magnetobacterium bavaricum]|uniref:Fe-S oxidoreductase n=1 Tax=Candidatus Magnetobacterium bavaricum TaxID=29290 RepID=A0A0F3H0P0_9BACT|nr:Fe-S oxidoreductase [Candidatus Magnetobacterium bavaricum]